VDADTSAAESEVPGGKEPLYIRSTMVGTFYRGDTSDRPPLVVEGTMVNSGDPVGSIEAMKIRKDVLSQHSGRIVRALVADGHAVEYGQPLFEVETENGNGSGHV
jgi:acetyl-CoA carboxylase biotin carboxyl carrier protein